MQEAHRYLLWLSSIEGLACAKANQLLEYFGSPKALYDADEVALEETGFLTRRDVLKITEKKYKERLGKSEDMVYQKNMKLISIHDEGYPELLKNIYDPPFLLYYKGQIQKNEKALAVVGARKCTTYGLKMAGVISQKLGELGFTIVSGLARGIDSAAHWACVEGGTRTIGVLGCGLDVVYPPENRRLADKMLEQGAIFSEFPPTTHPLPFHFPLRNRLISGISHGVIVIEAGEKSGSLITASQALEQGREVFALPGNVMSTKSTGTNQLIKDGAKMITGIQDILDELHLFLPDIEKDYDKQMKRKKQVFHLSEEEKKIVACLETEPLHVDVLLRQTGFSMKDLNACLMMLELQGVLESMPGKMYGLHKAF
jgi:DNA processing protein